MRTIALLTAAVLMCSLAVAGCTRTEQPVPLRVGTHPACPPFSRIDEQTGEIRGFDIDLITAIVSEIGTPVEIRALDPDALLPALLDREIDVIISAFVITDEPAGMVTFSNPYFIAGQAAAVLEDTPMRMVSELAGRRTGVQAHTSGRHALALIQGTQEKDTVEYQTFPELIQALQSHSVQAIVTDAPFLVNYLTVNPDSGIRVISPGFTIEFYGIAMRHEDTDLCVQINLSLARLIETGEYERLYTTWFSPRQ